jgi:hypothetical protein
MPDYIDDFNNEEFSLIAGESVSHIFDTELDDIKLSIFNEDGKLVIDPMGLLALYYIYDSSLYTYSVYDPTVTYDDINGILGFYLSETIDTGVDFCDGDEDGDLISCGDLEQTDCGNTNADNGNGVGDCVWVDNPDVVSSADIQITPNQILSQKLFNTGVYELNFHFLRNFFTIAEQKGFDFALYLNPKFSVQEISPSRKEVRLLIVDEGTPPNMEILGDMYETGVVDKVFGLDTTDGSSLPDEQDNVYSKYNFVFGISNGRYISLTNYIIDDSPGTTNDSLILRLSEPIPLDVGIYEEVTLDRKIITSQNQNISYISSVIGGANQGSLEFDDSFLPTSNTPDTLQNYNDLISGSTENVLHSIFEEISGSDVNLNIDYGSFTNHTFFGSAKQKLENFKTKVIDIENNLVEISSSLQSSGSVMADRRKILFDNIKTVKGSFTKYEKFLYYDNQHTSTGSAPGIGKNLALNTPISGGDLVNTLNNHEGFNVVYKHSNVNDTGYIGDINLFTGLYRAEKGPFYNYSGSVYLSFLFKGDSSITGSGNNLIFTGSNSSQNLMLPNMVFGSGSILEPAVSASEYRRYIYEASQSYWRPKTPNESTIADVEEIENTNFELLNPSDTQTGDVVIQVLSGSNITGSFPIIAPNYDTYGGLITTTQSNAVNPRSGSILPMGDLFPILWKRVGGTAISSSYITDTKVTLSNPINALPFSHLYSTGSSDWTNWYDGLYTSASNYDDDNIHSLQNNLPKILKESTDSADLQKFLNLLGEHYDLIRNYIDNYSTFYNRKYKSSESVPNNLLPIFANNLGWELINPFTGSLAGYYETVATDSNQPIQDITNNTWRKVLNNLVYIYKTKGTQESIKALLNTYGYPTDVVKIKEFGTSTVHQNPSTITNDETLLLQGLRGSVDNVSFIKEKRPFGSINLNGDKQLNFDWWTNSANGESIEFVLASQPTLNNQVLLESSGSGSEILWDLSLITSASSNSVGSLKFRLNTSLTGSLAITNNAISMSTSDLSIKSGNFWNVMIQRTSASLNSNVSQSYKLYVGLQDEDKITKFEVVSMSSANNITNVNFMSGSSLDITSSNAVSGNLVVGRTLSGSISEFRVWDETLSASKFKQHILNKMGVVGNTISSSRESIIYRYRLNENHRRNQTITLQDANPNYNGDYSRNVSLTNYGGLYNTSLIDVYKFSIRGDYSEQENSNKVLIHPVENFVENLNPHKSSVIPLENDIQDSQKRKKSLLVDISRSPIDKIDEYIINQLSDYDVSDKFADPRDMYEDTYNDLEVFRGEVLKGVSVNLNKYVSSQEKFFSYGIVESMGQLLPARTVVGSSGIVIRQDILKRNKIKQFAMSVYDGTAAGFFQGSFGGLNEISFDLSNSSYQSSYKGDLDFMSYIQSSGSYYNVHIRENSPYLNYVSEYFDINTTTYESSYNSTIDLNSDYYDLSKTTYDEIYNTTIEYIANTFSVEGTYQNVFIWENNPYLDYITKYHLIDGENINIHISNDISKADWLDVTANHFTDFGYDASINLISDYMDFSNSEYFKMRESNEIQVQDHYFSGNIEHLIPYSKDIDVLATSYILTGTYINSIIWENNPYLDYITEYYDLSNSEYKSIYKSTINYIEDYVDISNSEYKSIYKSTINYIEDYVDIAINYKPYYETSIVFNPEFSNDDYSKNWNVPLTFNMTYNENVHEGDNREIVEYNLGATIRSEDEWGNEVHFIHNSEPGNDGDYNTNYYERDVIFYAIGETELQSGSYNSANNWDVELYKMGNFSNRIFIDKNKGSWNNIIYNSYWVVSGSSDLKNPVPGRMIGRTSYFTSGSDGTLYYPPNHYISAGTSKQSLDHLFYGGTQNSVNQVSGSLTRPVRINWPHGLDISSASAYSIDVGGSDTDKVLKIERK